MKKNRLVCASSVLLGPELLRSFGEVVCVPEEEITRDVLKDADALFTRTKTRVDRSLLEGTPVRFVATATAGTDHMNFSELKELGIKAVSAPGCNAASVADYVTACLLHLKDALHIPLEGMTMGVVGVGQVGSRVAGRAEALGLRVLKNDPPRKDREGGEWTELDDLICQSDILSLHVPLVEDGPHPTRNLLNEERLCTCKPGMILLNACRGEVVDAPGLESMIRGGAIRTAILDVWPDEPHVPASLLDQVFLGSAHIAGHSWEGKFNGTWMNANAYADFLGCPRQHPNPEWYPEAPSIPSGLSAVREVVLAVYDPMEDDRLLREGLSRAAPGEREKVFQQLRRKYRLRREFSSALVSGWTGTGQDLSLLQHLGFKVT